MDQINRTPITSSMLIQWIALVLIMLAVISGIGILTGTFAPLQTSKVTSIGVCLQNDTLDMVKVVPANTDLIYICGTLAGATKKSFSAELYFDMKRVFYESGNWSSGNFFIPVKSTEQRFVKGEVFQPGDYRVGVAYGRAVALERAFKVAGR